MEIYEGILYGLGGGILAELSGLYKLRQQALPDFLKSPFYWVTTIAMIGAGGGLVSAYIGSGSQLSPILAVNLGASAPLIIGSLANQIPPVGLGNSN